MEKGKSMSRPVGSKNIRTEQWEKLGKWMVSKGAKRMQEVMKDMDDQDFAHHFLQLVRYFKPALSSAAVKQEGNINITLITNEKDLLDKL